MNNVTDYIETGAEVRTTFAETAISLYAHFMLADKDAVYAAMKEGAGEWLKAAQDWQERTTRRN